MELPENKTVLVSRGNKVVYDCGDRIVKVFNASKPESDVFNEGLNLARIQETGIRVPHILEVSKSDEGWALATEKVPGNTLAERIKADKKNVDMYLEQFVRLQLEINGHTAPLLNRQRDKYARMINSLTEIDATTRYELLIRLIMFCKMADMPMQVVRRWMSIVAASELARHREAKEEEFLRSWIDVAEYQ